MSSFPSACWNHRPEEEGITTWGFRLRFFWCSGWNHRPEEEGITTCRHPLPSTRDVGITALKKKGLRRVPPLGTTGGIVGITALKKKGLRRATDSSRTAHCVGITALKKKGLRHKLPGFFAIKLRWNHRPEEEGITTWSGHHNPPRDILLSPPRTISY